MGSTSSALKDQNCLVNTLEPVNRQSEICLPGNEEVILKKIGPIFSSCYFVSILAMESQRRALMVEVIVLRRTISNKTEPLLKGFL